MQCWLSKIKGESSKIFFFLVDKAFSTSLWSSFPDMDIKLHSWNWSSPSEAAAVFQLTKILMSYYLPGKFDTSSPGSGLPWGLCDLSCQGDNYFLWRGNLQHFCLSSQVELTVRASAGQREKEERDATYKMKVCTRSTCDGGIFTFEKTTAHFRRPGCEVALDLSSNPGHHLRVCRAALVEGDGLPRLLPWLQWPEVCLPG